MKLTCIIADDEPIAIKGIQNYVDKIPFLDCVAHCSNIEALQQELKQRPVDLLFLDIEMPYGTGIDFLKSAEQPPMVIFITAYAQYAIEGFNLNVLDYMLKPVSFERFFQGVSKAYEFAQHQESNQQDDFIWVKIGGRLEKIELEQIQYIESMQNYVILHLSNQKITVHNTLKNIATYLPDATFLKVHKSFIVNLNYIQSVEGLMLQVGEKIVPISRGLKDQVLERIINNRLLKK
ncbi:MAG: LytTR family DNA-binding domain-containing protein [Bacteroidota bacterium]